MDERLKIGYADCVVRKNAEKMPRIKKNLLWSEEDYFMTPQLAKAIEEDLVGRIVRCQVFPGKGQDRHKRVVFELEDGRAYAIMDGPLGPRIMQLEAYADDSNSYTGYDETSWYWRWKGSDRPVEWKFLGGAEW